MLTVNEIYSIAYNLEYTKYSLENSICSIMASILYNIGNVYNNFT